MIKYYKNFILEKSISDIKSKKFDTVLQNLEDIKETKKLISEIILELQENLSNIKQIKFDKYDEDNNKLYLSVKYDDKIRHYISNLQDILENSENLECFSSYFNLVYPDGEEKSFYIDIEIEKNNLNRIHVPDGLPFILKGIGFGKKIYLNLIKKYNYLSSNYLDRSMDSLYVWNSIRKEKDIYTFIFNQKILSIDSNLEFNKIEDILLEYYKNLTTEDIILDDDFQDKYIKEMRKSNKISWLLDYYLKQDEKVK